MSKDDRADLTEATASYAWLELPRRLRAARRN
jgi:hypothetical protein